FCSPAVRATHLEWERQAAATVARFRVQSGPAAENAELHALVERVKARAPEFERLWEDFVLREDSCDVQNLVHPHLGDLAFTRTTLAFTCQSGLTLNLLMPALGSRTQDKLGELEAARDPGGPLTAKTGVREGAGAPCPGRPADGPSGSAAGPSAGPVRRVPPRRAPRRRSPGRRRARGS